MKKDSWTLLILGIGVTVAILMSRAKASQPDIPVPCTPDWQCSEWSSCQNPGTGNWVQARECRDQNKCGMSGLPPPSENWKSEIRSCTPPPSTDAFKIELLLSVMPNPNYNAQPNEKLISWQIFIGNPTSQPVNVEAIVTLDGVVKGDPYVPLGNIPAGYPFREMAMGGYTGIYPGETHTVCISPRDPSASWSQICKTVVVNQ